MSSGSKPIRAAISSLDGRVPSLKSARSRLPVSGERHHSGPTSDTRYARSCAGADPGAQVVGRVEARVHVREVCIGAVADTGRLAEALGVAVRSAAVLVEAAPELELEAELRRVAPIEQRIEEDRGLCVGRRLLVREAEVLGVPTGLAGDRLQDERVDLGQRVVARQVAERVRKVGIAAGVVEGVPGLVQERLIVVEAALRSRDQVDDFGRIRGDHARTRRLLRAVVEVEADARLVGEIEAEPGEGLHADLDRALLRVRLLERGEPAHVRHVVRGGNGFALGAEQALEPAVPELAVRSGALVACHSQLLGERTDRDALLLLVSLDRIDGPRELGRELVLGAHQLSPSFVEAGGRIAVHFAELLAVAVRRQDGEPGLCRPERDLFALERDPLGEDRVLECVLALRELLVGDPGLALLAQAIETLGLVALGLLLGRAERIELLAAEEVGVRGDDRGPLGDLLLAHAHGADLFGTLEEVGAEPLLVLRRAANCCDRHRERESTRARRILRRISSSGPCGLAREQALHRAR